MTVAGLSLGYFDYLIASKMIASYCSSTTIFRVNSTVKEKIVKTIVENIGLPQVALGLQRPWNILMCK